LHSYHLDEGGGPTSILRKVFISEYLENLTYNFLNQTHCVACVRIAFKTNEGLFEQNITSGDNLLLSLVSFFFLFLVVVETIDAQ
jgi:hypothetical protein